VFSGLLVFEQFGLLPIVIGNTLYASASFTLPDARHALPRCTPAPLRSHRSLCAAASCPQSSRALRCSGCGRWRARRLSSTCSSRWLTRRPPNSRNPHLDDEESSSSGGSGAATWRFAAMGVLSFYVQWRVARSINTACGRRYLHTIWSKAVWLCCVRGGKHMKKKRLCSAQLSAMPCPVVPCPLRAFDPMCCSFLPTLPPRTPAVITGPFRARKRASPAQLSRSAQCSMLSLFAIRGLPLQFRLLLLLLPRHLCEHVARDARRGLLVLPFRGVVC
jgi:hypothetical protein